MITHDRAKDIIAWCYQVASLGSPDQSTQNAAVIVDTTFGEMLPGTMAVNQFPEGVVQTPKRWERPTKYMPKCPDRSSMWLSPKRLLSVNPLRLYERSRLHLVLSRSIITLTGKPGIK